MSLKRNAIPYISLAALAISSAALAGEGQVFLIDDPAWQDLTETERAELVKGLRDSGLLDPDDTLQYVGTPSQGPNQTNTGLFGSVYKAIKYAACDSISAARSEKCGEMSGSAKADCREDGKERRAKSKGFCQN